LFVQCIEAKLDAHQRSMETLVYARLLGSLCLLIVALSSPLAAASTVTPADDPARYGSVSAGPEGYALGVGDHVRITVFNEPTLSGEFAVNANGKLSLPLIGDLDAGGKNAADVAAAVQGALADGYLKHPQVSAEVVAFRPFFILGEVKAPGQYPYVTSLTVYNAIATAQGFSPRAERKNVFIRPAGSSAEKSYKLTPDLRVLPGDTLRIGERYF
jgi:polysaccharide export outer membrane protein